MKKNLQSIETRFAQKIVAILLLLISFSATTFAGTESEHTAVNDTIPVNKFTASADALNQSVKYNDSAETKRTVFTEASFPGGSTEWMHYLSRNFTYSQRALEQNIVGTLIVQFTVLPNGKTKDIFVASGPEDGGLRRAGIKLVKNSGKWVPATRDGVAVEYTRAIAITLRNEN